MSGVEERDAPFDAGARRKVLTPRGRVHRTFGAHGVGEVGERRFEPCDGAPWSGVARRCRAAPGEGRHDRGHSRATGRPWLVAGARESRSDPAEVTVTEAPRD